MCPRYHPKDLNLALHLPLPRTLDSRESNDVADTKYKSLEDSSSPSSACTTFRLDTHGCALWLRSRALLRYYI